MCFQTLVTSREHTAILFFSAVLGLISILTYHAPYEYFHLKPETMKSSEGVWLETRLPSSVWCSLGPKQEKLCRFKNLCYDPYFHEFQFLLSEESVVSGLQQPESWKNIDMSAVIGHNSFKMKISLLSPSNKNLKSFLYFNSTPFFIIHRFKSDNIMHVIHDDLLPLHTTYQSLMSGENNFSEKFTLVFADKHKESPLIKWYESYSKTTPISLSELNKTVCLADSFVGLLRNTLWFKYGFRDVQGPYMNYGLSVQGIRNFVQYNIKKWNVLALDRDSLQAKKNKIVIMVRNQTRRIKNLSVLIDAAKKAHQRIFPHDVIELVKIDLAIHSTTFVLHHISTAKLLIGMHGAGMILSLFLPPWTSVVELFPFAINPIHVSYLRSLCTQLYSYPLHYEFWQNKVRENSIPTLGTSPLSGSITHLSVNEQSRIKGLSEVPPVKCCHNPAYLYYMFQDTKISDDVSNPIHSALTRCTIARNIMTLKNILVFPSSPLHLSCVTREELVTVSWGEISNSKENENLWFEITISTGGNVFVYNITDGNVKTFSVKLQFLDQPLVWLHPHNKEIEGHADHTSCVAA